MDFLIKGDAKDETPSIMQLEERFLKHPALAIEQSRMSVNAMAEEARDNLTESIKLLHSYTDKGFDMVERMEGTVDRYEDIIGSYLVKLTGCELTGSQNEEVSK